MEPNIPDKEAEDPIQLRSKIDKITLVDKKILLFPDKVKR